MIDVEGDTRLVLKARFGAIEVRSSLSYRSTHKDIRNTHKGFKWKYKGGRNYE